MHTLAYPLYNILELILAPTGNWSLRMDKGCSQMRITQTCYVEGALPIAGGQSIERLYIALSELSNNIRGSYSHPPFISKKN